MTQHEIILSYLREHPEGITQIEGFDVLRITKINSRCGELRRMGYPIESAEERRGGKRWMRYYLGKPVQYAVEKNGQYAIV